jgi:TPR repeat protein
MPARALLVVLLVLASRAVVAAPADVPCPTLAACSERCKRGEKDICQFVETTKARAREGEAACDRGDVKQCSLMAAVYDDDPFFAGQIDPDIITRLLERACAGGDGVSCGNLGAVYAVGKGGVAKDDAKALATWKKGCELRSGHACMSIGNRYREGRGVARDLRVATGYLEKSCTLGSPDGCLYMGTLLEDAGTDTPARVRQLYERGCKLGSAWACLAAHRTGSTVSNPEAEAKMVQSERTLCNDGYHASCNNLGLAYELGVGVARDLAQAKRFRVRACDAGYALACHELANSALAESGGRGSPAVALYDKACRLEYHPSCETLGLLLIDGTQVPGDARRGVQLCTRACEQGLAASCRRLADLYRDGRAVRRDQAVASRYQQRACELGDRPSCKSRP